MVSLNLRTSRPVRAAACRMMGTKYQKALRLQIRTCRILEYLSGKVIQMTTMQWDAAVGIDIARSVYLHA